MIAALKKRKGRGFAEEFSCVSILFCDIVDFTTLAPLLSANTLVVFLSHLFRMMDDLADAFGVEKIKTIGRMNLPYLQPPARRAG